MTYEIDGKQYVAVASGGNFQLNYPRGDTLWVFSLDGTMGPVKAPPMAPAVSADASFVKRVQIVDYAFSSGVVIVPPGTTVTWTNAGDIAHTVTSTPGEAAAVKFDSNLLQPGKSYSFTFTKPGTYDYFCEPHPFMRGIVIVDPNAPAPAAPAASPAASS
jgi:amicyanin